ncbi:unnamed protein product, partial [Amoebophrya sp. A25]
TNISSEEDNRDYDTLVKWVDAYREETAAIRTRQQRLVDGVEDVEPMDANSSHGLP